MNNLSIPESFYLRTSQLQNSWCRYLEASLCSLIPLRIRGTTLFLVFFYLISSTGYAQTVCNGVVDFSCFTNTEDPTAVKCVTGVVNLTTLVNDGILLPAAEAQNTPQYVVVNGSIVINSNYKFAQGSEIVFTQNSGITVEPARTLLIHGTYLHGCTHLWSGIVLEGSSSIVISGSTLEDAVRGIWVKGAVNQFARIAAVYNNFRKNITAIELGLGSISTTNVGLKKGGITANTFDGAGPLLPGGQVTMPYAGIRVLRISPIVIGSTGFAIVFPSNNFINFRGEVNSQFKARAIEVQNSNVTIQNCRFEKIGRLNSNLISGYGVITISENGTHSLVFMGLGQNNNHTFTEVSCPISTTSGSLRVSHVNSTDTYLGIYYYNSGTPSSFPPGAIRIDNCTFDAYRSKTGAIFVGEGDKLLLSSLSISNCVIRDNQNLVFSPASGGNFDEVEFRSGIRIMSSEQTSLGLFSISGNEFYSDNKSTSATFNITGIRIVNIIGGRINNNQSYDYNEASAPTSNKFKGIWLDNCSEIDVFDNKVHGNADAYNVPSKRSDGISLYESGFCNLKCNDVDFVRNGIVFEGEGCDQSSMLQNEFNTHHNGLYLFSDAIIGQQGSTSPHENQWLSNSALLDGNYDFVGFDPLDQFSLNRANMSKFFINDVNATSIYWANPRTIGGAADMDFWFTDDDGQFPPAPSLTTCSNGFTYTGYPRLSKADQYVLDSNYPAYLGYPASTWEAGLRLYTNLAQNPSLRTSGSPAEAFYNSNSTGTLGKLFAGLESVRHFGQATEAINNIQAEMEELLDQAYILDEQIINAQNEAEEAQLLAQHDVLMEQVSQKQGEFEQLATNHLTASQQQATVQLANLNAATTSTTWEQNLKTVLQIQLGMLSSGLSLSETQQITVQTIANQCRYEGGYGVLLARKMLPGQEYDDNILCSERSNELDGPEKNSLNVFPNPASDFIILTANSKVSAGSAILINTFGQTVRTYQWEGKETRLNIADVPCGTYFLSIRSHGHPLDVQKLVILR
ncbi:MAG: T9SS type A sorting domain-containing protein [Saprospiraceae bacterium]